MAKSYTWNKDKITADQIEDILISQYGVGQPIVINMSDREKLIPYKSAGVSCTCTRCGATFTMTPKNICDATYNNGYVCIHCGPLSDEDVRREKQNKMVSEANRIAEEETGMTPEELMALKDKAKTNDPMTFEDLKAKAEEAQEDVETVSEDDMHDMFAEAMVDMEESTESTTPEVAEEKEPEMKIEEPQQPQRKPRDLDAEIIKMEGTIKEEFAEADEKPVKKEAPKKNIDAKKVTPKVEDVIEEKPVEKEESVQVEAEDEKPMTHEEIRDHITAEIVHDIATSEDDVFEEDDASEEPQDDTFDDEEKPTTEEDDDSLEVDFNDTPAEETEEEDDKVMCGGIEYRESELNDVWFFSLKRASEVFGYKPWNEEKCDIETDGTLTTECRICKKPVNLPGFAAIYKDTKVDKKFFEQYGTKFVPLENNIDGSTPIVTECPHCKTSVALKGFNEAHKNTVFTICKNCHLNLVNPDNHRFIYGLKEAFTVEANGVQKEITFIDLVKIFGKNSVDARTHEWFKPVEEEKVETTDIFDVEKTTESSSSLLEGIKIEHTLGNANASQNKPKPPKVDIRPKEVYGEDMVKEDIDKKAKEAMNQKLVLGEAPTIEDRGPDTHIKSGTFVFGKKDSHEDLNEEINDRKVEFEQRTIFKEGAKLKLARKNVATLNGKINPFKRNESLLKSFESTDFYRFFCALSQEAEVEFKVIVNNKTMEVPIVDFASGWRFICCDLNDGDMLFAEYNMLAKCIPFSFKEQEYTDVGNGELRQRALKFKTLILYSDSIRYRQDATFYALMKYIAPEKLAYKGSSVKLQDNLLVQYSTNDSYLRNFRQRYSAFPAGKPKTGELGIVATWEDSMDGRTAMSIAAQLHKDGNRQDLDSLQHERDQYMVASIAYIEKLIESTTNKRVIYTITDYLEIGTCLLEDGFVQCIRALLKEYKLKFPMATEAPYIKVELDPNNYFSPSLLKLISRGILLPVDDTYRIITSGNSQMYRPQSVEKHLTKTYVRRPEYRPVVHGPEDEQRHDTRMFNLGTLLADPNMRAAIEKAGMSISIRDPSQKDLFLANIGYEYCHQFQIKEYYINQSIIASIMNDEVTVKLNKMVEDTMFTNTKLVANSQSGSVFNNIMANPQLAIRYQKLMQNGTKESKDYLRRAMYQQMYGVDYSDQIRRQQMMGMNPMMMGGMMPNVQMMGMNGGFMQR